MKVASKHKQEASLWAQSILGDKQAVIFDTETTDLNGEIVEASVITPAGEVLFNGRFCPIGEINPAAEAVHGLTRKILQHEPAFREGYQQLKGILTSASRVIIYNADFDMKILRRTCLVHNVLPFGADVLAECAMLQYARWVGDWDPRRQSFRWHKLEGGDHSALGDCLATVKLLKKNGGGVVKEQMVECRVMVGATESLPNYSNVRAEIEMTMFCLPQDIDQTAAGLSQIATEKLHAILDYELQQHGEEPRFTAGVRAVFSEHDSFFAIVEEKDAKAVGRLCVGAVTFLRTTHFARSLIEKWQARYPNFVFFDCLFPYETGGLLAYLEMRRQAEGGNKTV